MRRWAVGLCGAALVLATLLRLQPPAPPASPPPPAALAPTAEEEAGAPALAARVRRPGLPQTQREQASAQRPASSQARRKQASALPASSKPRTVTGPTRSTHPREEPVRAPQRPAGPPRPEMSPPGPTQGMGTGPHEMAPATAPPHNPAPGGEGSGPARSPAPEVTEEALGAPEPGSTPGAEAAPVRQPGLLSPPRPVYAPPPEYPGFRLSVEAGEGLSFASAVPPHGRVRVRLLVRADGSVARVDVLVPSGQPELDRAAVEALGRWRFEPARRGGEPLDSYYLLWVVFEAR